MSALLQLVAVRQSGAVAAVPRVLNGETLRRLACVNAALRRLRELGVPALRIDLYRPTWPLIHIERQANRSLVPLLDAADTKPQWTPVPGADAKVGQLVFHGTLLCWREL